MKTKEITTNPFQNITLVLLSLGALALGSWNLTGCTSFETEPETAESQHLSDDEQTALERKIELQKMEQSLSDVDEREQYFNYKSHLGTDEARIEFLSLPDREARDRFAMQKGIYFRVNKFDPSTRDAVSRNDIILGMNQDAVKDSWGEPKLVEVAGEDSSGNERWSYETYVSSPSGFQKEERTVIFEKGKVAGWQRHE
jgi:hypothetical protein